MRIAAISDVHGNLPALRAVLADAERAHVDRIVNLGDIVSGPLMPAETADLLMSLDLPTLRGNHENQLLHSAREHMGPSDRHAASKLHDRHRSWLASLPSTIQLDPEVFCCHGTPSSDRMYFLETVVAGFELSGASGLRAATPIEVTERAGRQVQDVAAPLILCGHTHLPRVVQLVDGRLIVNPGSVGLPAYRDEVPQPHVVETGSPHARYAIVTREAAGWRIELRCVPYDWEEVVRLAEVNGRDDWAIALRTGFAR